MTTTKNKREIERAARCIFPGGKAVLVGYDAKDQFVIGVEVQTSSARRWAQQGVTAKDLTQVKEVYNA